MRIIVDRQKLKESRVDENGFGICDCGKHRYPSKTMLVRFLSPLRLNGKPVADIWSESDFITGEVTIHAEIKYKTMLKKK